MDHFGDTRLSGTYGKFTADEKLNYALKLALGKLQTELKLPWYKEPNDFKPKGPETVYKNKIPTYATLKNYYLIDPFCKVAGRQTSVVTNVTVEDILGAATFDRYGFGHNTGAVADGDPGPDVDTYGLCDPLTHKGPFFYDESDKGAKADESASVSKPDAGRARADAVRDSFIDGGKAGLSPVALSSPPSVKVKGLSKYMFTKYIVCKTSTLLFLFVLHQ